MPHNLVWRALRRPPPSPFITAPHNRRNFYDVVIIGGGGHGLATAYYLAANHGIRNVAVLEKGWLAGGNTARNTAIIRANYLTPEAVRFYKTSMEMFQNLSHELDFNILYSERGHLTLAHTDAACRTAKWRANVNRVVGVDSSFISPQQIAEICPQINLSQTARYPIMGALYHPPGAIARHDAVAWGYAMRAAEKGVHIFTDSEVVAVRRDGTRADGIMPCNGGRVTGVQLADGSDIAAGAVLQAVAGDSSRVAALAGFQLPITTVPLQAMVSQPLAPFLDPIVVSGTLHIYVSQTPRGELVMGGSTDPRPLYSTRGTARFKESLAGEMLQLFPFLGKVNILRQWAGKADMTPDFSPIMGETPLNNYYIDAGWGTWGFKATPVCGMTMAATIAAGKPHPLIESYALERFSQFALVGEKAAASVGH